MEAGKKATVAAEGAAPARAASPDVMLSTVFTVPNLLSAFRILLVPIFLWLVLERKTAEPLFVFFIAAITDFFDGFVARRFHQKSRLGIILDPAGDKLLMATSYIVLAIPGVTGPNRIPLWLTAVVFARDLMIASGVVWAYLRWRQPSLPPTIVGKYTTAFQVGTIFLVLLLNHAGIETRWMTACFALTLGLTVASGVQYYLRGLRIVRKLKSLRSRS